MVRFIVKSFNFRFENTEGFRGFGYYDFILIYIGIQCLEINKKGTYGVTERVDRRIISARSRVVGL